MGFALYDRKTKIVQRRQFQLKEVLIYLLYKRICFASNPQPACFLVFKDGKSQGETTNLGIKRENQITENHFIPIVNIYQF